MSKEERRNELNDSNGSAKQIGETIEYGDWYQDPFDGWSQVSNDPIEGDVLVGKHVTKDGTFFKQNDKIERKWNELSRIDWLCLNKLKQLRENYDYKNIQKMGKMGRGWFCLVMDEGRDITG